MEKKDKELLLKVLCDGLPYGLYIMHPIYGEMPVDYGFIGEVVESETLPKPYLRDMGDMTVEEKNEILTLILGKKGVPHFQVLKDGTIDSTDAAEQDIRNFNFHWIHFDTKNITAYTDWLNKKHFNWRGLPEERYIKVTKENNPYKE